jgi:hypothetical protein
LKYDDIKVHEVVHLKLDGERVYVINKGIDGDEAWVTCKRVVHTPDHGDQFVSETWAPDELITEAEFEAEQGKNHKDLINALKGAGVMVLEDMDVPRDKNAN